MEVAEVENGMLNPSVKSLGEGELYPDYKREALLKKREAEQAEAVKAAEEKIWPDLLGSEKQIA